ncbi:hypothetical protein HOY80DRAFT_1077022 [Tuber brumale]|nr:hypothetical protein HOY80DRAFT_1077022 [Tuber brumale]
MERVVEEERRLEKVEFAGERIVVKLPVAVAESVAGAVVAENVVMVEVAGKGKEVAVVAEEAEEGLGSREEDWTLVKRRVRESGEERRRRMLEEERDAVRKRMNVRHLAKVEVPNAPLGPRNMRMRFGRYSSYGSLGPSGLGKSVVVMKGWRG